MGGQGGTVPSKVLTGGTAVLTVPPKVQASEGHCCQCWVSCFVRSHKEYITIITYYNFESAIIKLQFRYAF